MKTIVASWDRHRIKDTIRTKMGANPLAYPHAFRSPEAPRELKEVFAASGSNQAFFDKLEELELMSTFQTFIDNYATHSLSYEFGYLECLNDLAPPSSPGITASGRTSASSRPISDRGHDRPCFSMPRLRKSFSTRFSPQDRTRGD